MSYKKEAIRRINEAIQSKGYSTTLTDENFYYLSYGKEGSFTGYVEVSFSGYNASIKYSSKNSGTGASFKENMLFEEVIESLDKIINPDYYVWITSKDDSIRFKKFEKKAKE